MSSQVFVKEDRTDEVGQPFFRQRPRLSSFFLGSPPGWLPFPEAPQVGLICLAGRHNPLEALRKEELHLGKLKGADGSGVAGSKNSPDSSRGVAQALP